MLLDKEQMDGWTVDGRLDGQLENIMPLATAGSRGIKVV